jgi:hypothetical protein
MSNVRVLIRPAGRLMALLAASFNLLQTAILAINKVFLLVPLFVATSDEAMRAVAPPVRGALASLAVDLLAHGFGVARKGRRRSPRLDGASITSY